MNNEIINVIQPLVPSAKPSLPDIADFIPYLSLFSNGALGENDYLFVKVISYERYKMYESDDIELFYRI